MTSDALSALEWYLKIFDRDLPAEGSVLAIRPDIHPLLEGFRERPLVCYQTFFPHAQALKEENFEVTTEVEGQYALILGVGTKFKEENLFHLALAYEHLQPGGQLLFVIHNKIGAKSYLKYLKELFGEVFSESKNRCKIYRAVKGAEAPEELLLEWKAKGGLQPVEGTELETVAGTFSSKKPDTGSLLLVQHLPHRLRGAGADLGSGYGFLSHAVLSRDYPITALHLYEAEYRALQAARHNLEGMARPDLTLTFNWADVNSGLSHRKLDWIVMNPPFHQGKATDIGVGEQFVRVASEALRRKGQLFMVANRHLPYEKVLESGFSSYQKLFEGEGYKVFHARK